MRGEGQSGEMPRRRDKPPIYSVSTQWVPLSTHWPSPEHSTVKRELESYLPWWLCSGRRSWHRQGEQLFFRAMAEELKVSLTEAVWKRVYLSLDLKYVHASDSPKGFVKMPHAGSDLGISNSGGQGWGLRTCVPNEFSGHAAVAGLRFTLREWLNWTWGKDPIRKYCINTQCRAVFQKSQGFLLRTRFKHGSIFYTEFVSVQVPLNWETFSK